MSTMCRSLVFVHVHEGERMPQKLKKATPKKESEMATCVHCGLEAPKEQMIAHGKQHFCCRICYDSDQKK